MLMRRGEKGGSNELRRTILDPPRVDELPDSVVTGCTTSPAYKSRFCKQHDICLIQV